MASNLDSKDSIILTSLRQAILLVNKEIYLQDNIDLDAGNLQSLNALRSSKREMIHFLTRRIKL